MPAPQVHLDLADSAELAEMLTFISQWLGGTDRAQKNERGATEIRTFDAKTLKPVGRLRFAPEP